MSALAARAPRCETSQQSSNTRSSRPAARPRETSREERARLPNTAALRSHTKRSTRRARTAVGTKEPPKSAASPSSSQQRQRNN